MRHLTILVDMDDTIENLAEAWVAYLNARHQTSTNLSDITDWDISKAFPALTKEQVYIPDDEAAGQRQEGGKGRGKARRGEDRLLQGADRAAVQGFCGF